SGPAAARWLRAPPASGDPHRRRHRSALSGGFVRWPAPAGEGSRASAGSLLRAVRRLLRHMCQKPCKRQSWDADAAGRLPRRGRSHRAFEYRAAANRAAARGSSEWPLRRRRLRRRPRHLRSRRASGAAARARYLRRPPTTPGSWRHLDRLCRARHLHADHSHPERCIARDAELRGVTEIAPQPVAYVAQAVAVPGLVKEPCCGLLEARPVVADLDPETVLSNVDIDLDPARHANGAHLVLNGVFHQRLNNHRGNPHLLSFVASPDRKLQPVSEPRPLDIEVSTDRLEFFVQRYPLPFGAPQGVAKHFRQLLDGPFG